MPNSCESITIDIGHLTLHALEKRGAGPKILAIHGWLDNAASFVPLFEHLDAHIIALDLPGCGYSDHYPDGFRYHFVDTAHCINLAAKAIGWPNYLLMGHSLGANLCPWVYTAAQDAIDGIIMIDGAGPVTESNEAMVARLGKAQAQSSKSSALKRIYSTPQAAIEMRLKATDMRAEDATLIVERNLVETDGGYTWRSDPKWRLPSPNYYHEEQVLSVLEHISVPVLWIVANNGVLTGKLQNKVERRAQQIPKLTQVSLDGNHHIHMEQAAATAQSIKQWLTQHTM